MCENRRGKDSIEKVCEIRRAVRREEVGRWVRI